MLERAFHDHLDTAGYITKKVKADIPDFDGIFNPAIFTD